jgi:methylated-DNA-[protein]-cysteine S-methyltransferase
MTTLHHRFLDSPVGRLTLVADDDALVGLWFPDREGATGGVDTGAIAGGAPVEGHPVLELAAAELVAYFAGARTAFTVPVAPRGTPFQRAVWAQLAAIPFAETRSYGQLARTLGRPGGARAVGLANGRNPVAIILPCHRVIGADGSLTGFGGGLPAKRWLLEHERAVADAHAGRGQPSLF